MFIHLVYGHQKYDLELPDCVFTGTTNKEPNGSGECENEWTVDKLKELIATTVDVPAANQRLIFRGKTLIGGSTLLSSLGIKEKDKMMVLGRKPVPLDDPATKALGKVACETLPALQERLRENCEQIDGIEKGFLAKELHPEAFKKLDKHLRSINEECMRALEHLDSITVGCNNLGELVENDLRSKRKQLIKSVQELLTEHDGLRSRLDTLAKGSS